MKIEKYVKLSKNKYRIIFENGEVFDTYDNVILDNDLLLTHGISLELYKKILNDTTMYEKYYSCLKYISIRIRSTNEIKKYLKKKGASEQEINLIIEKLLATKNLDDDYFTKCYINDKLKFTSWGPYKIIFELKQHDINQEIINKYNYLFESNLIYNKISKIIDKQIEANSKLDKYKLKNKIYNHLFKSGYDSSMITNILSEKL